METETGWRLTTRRLVGIIGALFMARKVRLMIDRPTNLRPLFTVGRFDSTPPYENERLRSGGGPIFHAGKPSRIRPVWKDDYDAFRMGHTDDMIAMLENMRIETRAY